VTGAKDIGQDGQPIELALFAAALGAFGVGVLQRRAVGEDDGDVTPVDLEKALPERSTSLPS
jgi:hypothetical protein